MISKPARLQNEFGLPSRVRPSLRGCRDGSVVKSICCSCRESIFSSQHPHGDLQLPLILVPGDLMSSDLLGYQAQTCAHTDRQNCHTHKINESKI